jgi:hypothetical protein
MPLQRRCALRMGGRGIEDKLASDGEGRTYGGHGLDELASGRHYGLLSLKL